MIVHGIRCDACKKDYPGTSAASAKDIRKEAEANGWSVGFPAWGLMAWKQAMEYKAAGGRGPTADKCPECHERSMRECFERISKGPGLGL